MTETTTTQTAEASKVSGRRARIVTAALSIPGTMALGLSASTSYRYVGQRLGITDFAERLALCATVEAAIIGLTLHSWGTRSKASAWAAYALVAVQSIPAFEVSGGAGGVFRIAAGPVLLALMLHKLLGLEVKLSGGQSAGLLAAAGRELRERLTARLGIGRRGADSAAIARSRAADRAVKLASRRKLTARDAERLAEAIDAAQHDLGADAAAVAEASIVARVMRRKSVAELHGLEARHVWSPAPAVPGTSPNQALNVPEYVPGYTSGARTPAVPAAGHSAIALPQPRRTRRHAADVPADLAGVPEYTNESALRARAVEIDDAVIAATGRPAGVRPLREGLGVGGPKATEIRDWLAARREQQPAEVAHVNGYGSA